MKEVTTIQEVEKHSPVNNLKHWVKAFKKEGTKIFLIENKGEKLAEICPNDRGRFSTHISGFKGYISHATFEKSFQFLSKYHKPKTK